MGCRGEKVEPVTFAELGMTENDLEQILRNSIDMLCDEEESMLIIGRQVRNEEGGRSDLTAIDNNGSIVLIELKRDLKDIGQRRESFEFQAIRYAASYATIKTPDELVRKIYAPYIEKHRAEFELGELTAFELGKRKLLEFLRENDAERSFNAQQRIILAASDFDKQTLSAAAWLDSNTVGISCYRILPYCLQGDVYIDAERILPLPTHDDYYVDLLEDGVRAGLRRRASGARRTLPRIDALLDWGAVTAGDILVAKGRADEATLLGNGNVDVDGTEMSMQAWLRGVFDWSSVATYTFAIHKQSGKSLSQIRDEYMEQQTIGNGK